MITQTKSIKQIKLTKLQYFLITIPIMFFLFVFAILAILGSMLYTSYIGIDVLDWMTASEFTSDFTGNTARRILALAVGFFPVTSAILVWWVSMHLLNAVSQKIEQFFPNPFKKIKVSQPEIRNEPI